MTNTYRNSVSNMYKTKDGKYFHLHGSLNATPTFEFMGLPPYNEDISQEDAIKLIQTRAILYTAKELEAMADQHKQAGAIVWTEEEFAASAHVRFQSIRFHYLMEYAGPRDPPATCLQHGIDRIKIATNALLTWWQRSLDRHKSSRHHSSHCCENKTGLHMGDLLSRLAYRDQSSRAHWPSMVLMFCTSATKQCRKFPTIQSPSTWASALAISTSKIRKIGQLSSSCWKMWTLSWTATVLACSSDSDTARRLWRSALQAEAKVLSMSRKIATDGVVRSAIDLAGNRLQTAFLA